MQLGPREGESPSRIGTESEKQASRRRSLNEEGDDRENRQKKKLHHRGGERNVGCGSGRLVEVQHHADIRRAALLSADGAVFDRDAQEGDGQEYSE